MKEFSKEDKKLLGKLAQTVVSRRLTAPAILFLETSKPLSFIGSQFLVAIQPFIQAVFNFNQYDRIVQLLEDRENVELFIQLIESMEAEKHKVKK